MPYGAPMPYMMVPVPTAPPSKKFAAAGGIISIAASAIVLILILMAWGNKDYTRVDAAKGIMGFTVVLTAAAVLMSVFAIQGKWWGALVAGILQTVNVLMTLALCGAAQEAKTKIMFEDFFYESERAKALETLTTLFAFSVLGVLLAAIFCYIGISGAKRWAQYKAHLEATGAF
jgi:hypothetical protein